jgi:hypothetical protein
LPVMVAARTPELDKAAVDSRMAEMAKFSGVRFIWILRKIYTWINRYLH